MLLKLAAEGCFSAIAASFNNVINTVVQKRRFTLLLHAGYDER